MITTRGEGGQKRGCLTVGTRSGTLKGAEGVCTQQGEVIYHNSSGGGTFPIC